MSKNNLYILRVYGQGSTLIKFGFSNSICKRIQAYFRCNPLTEVVGTAYFKEAYRFEQDLHKQIDSVVGKEWYTEDKLNIVYSLLAEKNIKLEEGIPIEVKEEKELSYREYADKLKNLNKQEALELVKTIENKIWQPLFYYGIETDNILPTYTKARLYYEAKINYDKNCAIEEELNDIVRNKFQVNKFYTSTFIKSTLQKIYTANKLNRKAKATDLNEFLTVQPKTQRIAGVVTKGLIVLTK